MKLVYPVIVFFVKGEFKAHIPCVGEYEDFCKNYIESNNLDASETEVYLYDRKAWISLLLEVKTNKHQFIIEKNRAFTTKKVLSEEQVNEEVDWMKEDNLSAHYTAAQIVKIEANKAELLNHNIITTEVLSGLPHKIPTKTRSVSKKILVEEVVTEIVGLKHEL